MKLVLILFMFCSSVFASESDTAIETSSRAILAYPEVQRIQKEFTTRLERTIPIPKEYAAPVASITLTLIRGKIDTKVIKTNYTIGGGIIRPDVFYNMKTDELKGIISINWSY